MLIVALPLLAQVLFVATLVRLERSRRVEELAEIRSKETIVSAYRVLGLLVDIQTGLRGYAIAGERRFAEPYENAMRLYPAEMRHLHDLADDTERQITAADLEALARVVVDHHRANIELLHAGQNTRVLESIQAGAGKNLMDAFRKAIDQFLAEQKRLDVERSEGAHRSRRRVLITIAVGFVANIVLAVLMAQFFTRGIARRVNVLLDNTSLLARGEALRERQTGGDEIAELDTHFHEMAAALTTSRNDLLNANREMESFSYSISHDLRAPLRAVSGYARILKEDYAAILDADGQRYVAAMSSEADRMGTLIDSLLAFSRLNREALHPVDFDPAVLVAETFRDVVMAHPHSAIRLECGDLPPAHADRPLLRQVFFNLLSNAAKFSSHKDEVVIEVGATPGVAENTFWIRDYGAGFDMRYVDKLFGVFQRLHTSAEFEGTGVGLAVVHRIVERHGGRVWAEGRPGQGATFSFTLPTQ